MIRNLVLIAGTMLFASSATAQRSADCLVKAELAIAAYAAQNGSCNAFLRYMDGADLHFELVGSGKTRSGDLAYVYGTHRHAGKTVGFLHLWQREGDRWRMAAEVLRY